MTGLSAERIHEARARLDALRIEHVSAELCGRVDVDAAAAACMVTSAIDALVERGVEESKLVGKLRRDRDVWASVVELIAGRLVLRFFDSDLELEMDRGAPGGPNADFCLSGNGPDWRASIEFKALGISDVETCFFRDVARVLPDLVPRSGVTTYHVPFGQVDRIPMPDAFGRSRMEAENHQRQQGLPQHIRDLRGAVVAAHFAENHYIDRVRDRVELAVRQLDSNDDCWVAFWWSNGAPLLALRDALSVIDLPEHVLGLMVVGAAVAVPDPEIHYYHALLPRPELSEDETELPVVSLEDNPVAAPILSAYEGSAGIRPTLLVEPDADQGSFEPLLFRDGSRRIFPFNLLIGSDPSPWGSAPPT